MLNNITKYWALIFYFATLCCAYVAFSSIGHAAVYLSLCLGLLTIAANVSKIFSPNGLPKMPVLVIFIITLITYQFSFGLFHPTDKSWSYFISKLVVCLAIASTLCSHHQFYHRHFLEINAYITVILLLVGIFFFRTGFGGRLSLGFGNPNALGAVAATAAGTLLISNKLHKKFTFASFIVCTTAVLMSGSRVAVGMLFLAAIIKFGIKIRAIISLGLIFLTINMLHSVIAIDSVAIDRFSSSLQTMDFSSGREREREATILMIKESPITGNGLYAQQSERAKEISELGSHCGYLDIIKMMGVPLGGIIVVSLIFQGLKLFLKYINSVDSTRKQHLYVISSILVAACFEAYIWGVFQVTTTIFFISFASLQVSSKYERK